MRDIIIIIIIIIIISVVFNIYIEIEERSVLYIQKEREKEQCVHLL